MEHASLRACRWRPCLVNSPPRKIPERGLHASVWREFNRLIDYVREISPTGGRNIRLTRTLNGTLTAAEATTKGTDGEVRQYLLKSIENDFYTCRSWNGTTEGESDIFIARPFGHRYSNFHGRTIAYNSDGDSFSATYDYTSATKRTKTVAGVAETQVLVPYFKNDFDLIYAVRVKEPITVGAAYTPLTDPNDVPIRLLDLNVEGRAWAKLETTQGN